MTFTSLVALISSAVAFSVAGETVVDVIVKDRELTTLVTALKAANLVGALEGQGPFTVWAPTNDAFARLPKGTLEHLLDPANIEELQAVLLYHVCPKRLDLSDYNAGTAATLDVGKNVTRSLDGGVPFLVKVNGIQQCSSELEASNGYATKLDGVLLPPTFSSLQV